MIVEVFVKGSHFKKLIDTYWSIKSIQYDGKFLILISGDNFIALDSDDCEIRVCA